MEENSEIKQTKLRNIRIEVDVDLKFEEIKKEKPEQCCFKNRYVDGFILGACRSVYNNSKPKELPKGKNQLVGSIPMPSLVDRENLKIILQIIGYRYALEQSEGDLKKINSSHEIILDLSQCTLVAERLFKREWDSPSPSNFKNICDSKNPDSKLVEDFNLKEFKKLLEETGIESQ